MKLFKKLIIILYLFLFYTQIYSFDYYICLGSFLDNNNSIEYSSNLNNIGIKTIYEKIIINNKTFTRVLYEKKFTNLNDAIKELNQLKNNKIIKNENIFDLWVRPGKLLGTQVVVKKDSDKKNNDKIKKDVDAGKENDSIKEDNLTKKNDKSDSKKNKEEEIVKADKIEKKEPVKEGNIKESVQKEEITKSEKYKIINKEGYANSIFAGEPLEFGKIDNYKLKDTFNKDEKIYARSYLPGKIGKVKAEDFWHEIWINGIFIRKTVFKSAPDPDWDQIQIWISEDEYKDIISSLEKGEYKIIIWVLKNEIKEEKEKKEVITVRLSKGEFTYMVL